MGKETQTQPFDLEILNGGGQYVLRVQDEYIKDTGYLSTVMYKVGYHHNSEFPDRNQGHCLISMSDGWTLLGFFKDHVGGVGGTFVPFSDKMSMVNYLNKQGFRMATQEECVRVVMYQNSRWSKGR